MGQKKVTSGSGSQITKHIITDTQIYFVVYLLEQDHWHPVTCSEPFDSTIQFFGEIINK